MPDTPTARSAVAAAKTAIRETIEALKEQAHQAMREAVKVEDAIGAADAGYRLGQLDIVGDIDKMDTQLHHLGWIEAGLKEAK